MARSSVRTARFTEVPSSGKVVVRLDGPSPAALAKAAGRALRARTSRSSHVAIGTGRRGRDPVAIILASNADRLPNLVPVRHSRMLESPFAFYRGAAALQARDLAHVPSSGVVTQCCGDAHLLNFGGFATPERNFIFDVNDFDETFPAPFEWDLKRLAASLVLAARWRGFSDARARDIAMGAVAAYRMNIASAAGADTLDCWYATITWEGILASVKGDRASTARVARTIAKAQDRTSEHVFHKLTTLADGVPRLLDQPPLLYHPSDLDVSAVARAFLEDYAATLGEDRRNLFARLRFVDAAIKVVGVGSVGTRCYVVLMLGEQNEPIFLQVKEARASVLAGHAGTSPWASDGERVVVGQRLMQAASDIFLGWAKGPEGRNFYLRLLRDMKTSAVIETMDARQLGRYGGLCAETLARAHAKSGGAARIAGYLGKSDAFDQAMGKFSTAYAEQAEKDYEAFRRAAANGRITTAAQGGDIQTMLQ